jgi:hypothetical protein
VLAYLRKNTLAFVALCVALFSAGGATAYAVNTIRSTDIVDGQVLTQDLGNNAVTTAKIKDGQVTNPDIAANSIGGGKIIDNNLTGADINEATLGRVPDAGAVAGVPAGSLRVGTQSNTVLTGSCTSNQVWTACAPVTVTVPSGHYYSVTVTSNVTLNPGGIDNIPLMCVAYTGPTCIGSPDHVTFTAGRWSTANFTAYQFFGAGDYTFSTAIKATSVVASENTAHTKTLVSWHDYLLEGIGTP